MPRHRKRSDENSMLTWFRVHRHMTPPTGLLLVHFWPRTLGPKQATVFINTTWHCSSNKSLMMETVTISEMLEIHSFLTYLTAKAKFV
jgi:hypothetical protein